MSTEFYEGMGKGSSSDPMRKGRIGGVNVFGGGLALYNNAGVLIGAVGVSGDTSCADHNIAWKVRDTLVLDFVPTGVSNTADDNIIYTPTPDNNEGFVHPVCAAGATTIGEGLPISNPISDIP